MVCILLIFGSKKVIMPTTLTDHITRLGTTPDLPPIGRVPGVAWAVDLLRIWAGCGEAAPLFTSPLILAYGRLAETAWITPHLAGFSVLW